MKDIMDKYLDEILILTGIIAAIAIVAWMMVSIVDKVNDQNAVKEKYNSEEFIANIEACTQAGDEDIKDCILLTIDDK